MAVLWLLTEGCTVSIFHALSFQDTSWKLQNCCTISHSRVERILDHRCWLELDSETTPADCTSKAFQLRSTWPIFPLLDKVSFEISSSFSIICLPPELTALLPPLGSSEGARPCRQLQSSDRVCTELIAEEVSSYFGRKRNLMPDKF